MWPWKSVLKSHVMVSADGNKARSLEDLDKDSLIEDYLREVDFLFDEQEILNVAKHSGVSTTELQKRFSFVREQLGKVFESWKEIYWREVERGRNIVSAVKMANKIFDAAFATAQETADSIYPLSQVRKIKTMDPAWKAPQ